MEHVRADSLKRADRILLEGKLVEVTHVSWSNVLARHAVSYFVCADVARTIHTRKFAHSETFEKIS